MAAGSLGMSLGMMLGKRKSCSCIKVILVTCYLFEELVRVEVRGIDVTKSPCFDVLMLL